MDEESKQKLIDEYLSHAPDGDTSKLIVSELAEKYGLKEASIRHHLVKAGVYKKAVKWRDWDIKAEEKQAVRDKLLLFGTVDNRHEIIEEFANKFFIRPKGLQRWAESDGVWPLTDEEAEIKRERDQMIADERERAWKASPTYKENKAAWDKIEKEKKERDREFAQSMSEYKRKENLSTFGGCLLLIIVGALLWTLIFGGDSRSRDEKGIEAYCTRQGLHCSADQLGPLD